MTIQELLDNARNKHTAKDIDNLLNEFARTLGEYVIVPMNHKTYLLESKVNHLENEIIILKSLLMQINNLLDEELKKEKYK